MLHLFSHCGLKVSGAIMTILQEMWIQYNIKYFTIAEVTKGLDIPTNLLINIAPTIVFADTMRERLGFPMTPTNSYRSEAHNAAVGGAKNSLHLVFNALDIVPMSHKESDLRKMQHYVAENRTREMGVGYYPNFIHLDFRGRLGRRSPATWGEMI